MKKRKLIYVSVLSIFFILSFYIIRNHIEKKRDYTFQFPCGVAPNLLNDIRLDSLGVELVFDAPYKWNKETLRVFFVDIKDENLKEKTLKIANKWSRYSNIKFELSKSIFRSEIRVSFYAKNGYSSAVGNQAKDKSYLRKPTLSLQNLQKQSDAEFKRVVLHEFGHAIGLQHELQSPASTIDWDSIKVYDYYLKVYKWDKAMVNHNILTKINTEDYTDFDSKSIMIYAIPDSLTKNHTAIPWPSDLSNTDKKTIGKFYPTK